MILLILMECEALNKLVTEHHDLINIFDGVFNFLMDDLIMIENFFEWAFDDTI